MYFVKHNCEKCACHDVCSVKTDVNSFRTDMMKMEWYGGKTYAERLDMITVKLECKNYIDKEKLVK